MRWREEAFVVEFTTASIHRAGAEAVALIGIVASVDPQESQLRRSMCERIEVDSKHALKLLKLFKQASLMG